MVYQHESAFVDEGATIGEGTRIWHGAHICSKASVGKNCNIGQNVYIDNYVVVGDFCKIQNDVNIYDGVIMEDYVFCGPSMTFTNVRIPRCLYPKNRKDYVKTRVKYGASLGANVTVVCGVVIGQHAIIGSGRVVNKDIKNYALVVGNPCKQIGWVCECGHKLTKELICVACGKQYREAADGLEEVIY